MKPIQIQESGRRNAAKLSGEASGLLEQLGALDPFSSLDGLRRSLHMEQVDGLSRLKVFLEAYQTQVLAKVEFPYIIRACSHAVRGEARELIELDAKVGCIPQLESFASASRRIGRWQLERLRPLRDHRVAKRYLAAMDTGEAHGWHPLVYGLTIAIYSLPHRQALLHYGEATLAGLADAASRSTKIPPSEMEPILQPLRANLPSAVEAAVRLL